MLMNLVGSQAKNAQGACVTLRISGCASALCWSTSMDGNEVTRHETACCLKLVKVQARMAEQSVRVASQKKSKALQGFLPWT